MSKKASEPQADIRTTDQPPAAPAPVTETGEPRSAFEALTGQLPPRTIPSDPSRAHQGTIPDRPEGWFDDDCGQAAALLDVARDCVERAHALFPSTLPAELYRTWMQILHQERLELHRQDIRRRQAARD